MQTLAVVCSLLRNFAAVVVGVTRPEDEQYLAHTVSDRDESSSVLKDEGCMQITD